MTDKIKPWLEVAIPLPDILDESFLQSDFTVDLNAVRNGKAPREYQEAKLFVQRTYITEGMRNLLIAVANRLAGKECDPILRLQASAGEGKTHSMLAVYHLARATESPIEWQGMQNVPRARVAVIDGISLSPGQARQHGVEKISTLWGELTWQLGGETLYTLIAESDKTGNSPEKEILQNIIEQASPVVILIDALVAYFRQFEPGGKLPGGTCDTNLGFLQALTEAVNLVPNAVLLVSLPEHESEIETEDGSSHELNILEALENIFGHAQTPWKPATIDEACEIVRRKLFSDIQDTVARDETCTAFANTYLAKRHKFPVETQAEGYKNRMIQSYPIHPEVFDRLYGDWSLLQGFQRTRSVLKLMAKIIHRLWQDQNQDYLIMPESFPLYDSSCRDELTQYLPRGWDLVIEKNIDGDKADTNKLEKFERMDGRVLVTRGVARTIFMGTAPTGSEIRSGSQGMDTAHILLGCVQPGHDIVIYIDALTQLSYNLHHLYFSSEHLLKAHRYWFDTLPNLVREMKDRKDLLNDEKEVRERIVKEIRSMITSSNLFDWIHIFDSSADVPDDTALRLVILLPEGTFETQDTLAYETVREYTSTHGSKPRQNQNRLLFLKPEIVTYSSLVEEAKTALAWETIIDDIDSMRLSCNKQWELHVKEISRAASSVLPTTVRKCFHLLLYPEQKDLKYNYIAIKYYEISSSGSSFIKSIEEVCRDNKLV